MPLPSKNDAQKLRHLLNSPDGKFFMKCLREVSDYDTVASYFADERFQTYKAGKASVFVEFESIKNNPVKE